MQMTFVHFARLHSLSWLVCLGLRRQLAGSGLQKQNCAANI